MEKTGGPVDDKHPLGKTRDMMTREGTSLGKVRAAHVSYWKYLTTQEIGDYSSLLSFMFH